MKVTRTNEIFISLQDEEVAVVADEEVAGDDAQLDPKNMKVAELRAELDARNLPSKGEKNFQTKSCTIFKTLSFT